MVPVEESDFLPVACTLVCINQHCDFPERKKYNGVDPIPIKGLPHLGTLPLKDVLRRYDSCKFPVPSIDLKTLRQAEIKGWHIVDVSSVRG